MKPEAIASKGVAMSIEGPGLYQDDTGHDVRSEFRELVGAGHGPDEGTAELLSRWADVLDDEDVYCAFYLALADTQWRLGRPVQAVHDAALSIINSGRDLKRWEYSPEFHRKRKRILEQLRERLLSDPPPVKPVRKPAAPFLTRLETGDVIRYTAEGGDEFILAVVGVDQSNNQRVAVVRLMDWDRLSTPPISSAPSAVRFMANVQPFALMPYRGADLPTKRSERVMRMWPVPAAQRQDTIVGCSIVSWGVNFDSQLRWDRQHQ
jgi:hypothetical protein